MTELRVVFGNFVYAPENCFKYAHFGEITVPQSTAVYSLGQTYFFFISRALKCFHDHAVHGG